MRLNSLLFLFLIIFSLFLIGCSGTPPVCGNSVCENGEDSYSCPEDCGNPQTHFECLDNTCTEVEGAGLNECTTSFECHADPCGNGLCESDIGEDENTCPQDCEQIEIPIDINVQIDITKTEYEIGEEVQLK